MNLRNGAFGSQICRCILPFNRDFGSMTHASRLRDMPGKKSGELKQNSRIPGKKERNNDYNDNIAMSLIEPPSSSLSSLIRLSLLYLNRLCLKEASWSSYLRLCF